MRPGSPSWTLTLLPSLLPGLILLLFSLHGCGPGSHPQWFISLHNQVYNHFIFPPDPQTIRVRVSFDGAHEPWIYMAPGSFDAVNHGGVPLRTEVYAEAWVPLTRGFIAGRGTSPGPGYAAPWLWSASASWLVGRDYPLRGGHWSAVFR